MSALFISKEFGLCNRLRGLLNTWAIAREKKLHLDVLWIVNDDCPFEFTDLFELLPNMTIMKEYKCDIENIKNYSFITDYAGCLEEFCPLSRRKRSFHECNFLFTLLRPVERIRDIIKQFVRQNNITNCSGIQVRRTDHVSYAEENKCFTPLSTFEQVIEHPENSDTKVYLACDCAETQDYFKSKYGDKILFYKHIENSSSLRKTDGVHAVVDLYVLSLCRLFFGTFGSSFSKHVLYLQNGFKTQRKMMEMYV
jgi:hypothetical protein